MGSFLFRRTLQSLVVIVLITVISFGLIHAAPGDPVMAIYGPRVQELSEEDRERIKENMGLNQPLVVQYGKWLQRMSKGDLGESLVTGRPVLDSIMERLPATVLLAGASALLILVLSLSLGVLTGLKRGSAIDHLTTVFSLIFISTPGFWLGLMLILIFGVGLKILPTAGMKTLGVEFSVLDLLSHLILPAVVLSVSHLGYYIRFVRASFWEQYRMDYVWALRARGIQERAIIFKHVLKNSLLPYVNYLGVTLPVMLGGAVVVETVFAWPGLGQLSVQAAASRDYSMLMGCVLLAGILVVLGNFCADLVCMILDPRVAAGQLGEGAVGS